MPCLLLYLFGRASAMVCPSQSSASPRNTWASLLVNKKGAALGSPEPPWPLRKRPKRPRPRSWSLVPEEGTVFFFLIFLLHQSPVNWSKCRLDFAQFGQLFLRWSSSFAEMPQWSAPFCLWPENSFIFDFIPISSSSGIVSRHRSCTAYVITHVFFFFTGCWLEQIAAQLTAYQLGCGILAKYLYLSFRFWRYRLVIVLLKWVNDPFRTRP